MTNKLIPYLSYKDAAKAIDFYGKAFGATEWVRLTEPGGKVAHAEIHIGEAEIMLADEYPDQEFRSAESLGGCPVSMALAVDDVDAVVRQAVAAGATLLKPVQDEFYGDRSGKLRDPFGYVWHVATRKEEISADEMQKRWAALMAQ